MEQHWKESKLETGYFSVFETISNSQNVPLIVQLMEELQKPVSSHTISVPWVGLYPSLHDCVAVAPNVVTARMVNKTDPWFGDGGEPQSIY